MENNIKIKNYTINEIKEWLYDNIQNGLTEQIISKIRAFAIVNNPNAQNDDVALVIASINENIVGFTAMFAEEFIKPAIKERYFWGTTLVVDPAKRGRGIGKELMKEIKGSIDYKYLGLDSSPASVNIDKKLGSKIYYYDRYYLKLADESKKSGLYLLKYTLLKWKNGYDNRNFIKSLFKTESFEIEYVSFIDNETYDFIAKHSSQDLFLRTKETFNWILKYHFVISSPIIDRQKSDYEFIFASETFFIHGIKVMYDDHLIGVYLLKDRDRNLSILYLYFEEVEKIKVFKSIAEHIIKKKAIEFRTFNADLVNFLSSMGLKPLKIKKESVSLTVPADFYINPHLKIQGGDGDMLC